MTEVYPVEQLEFGFRDILNWGRKAVGWAGRTARNVARGVIHIPDFIKRLIKAVIGKRNKAIQKYHQLRRANPRYARVYYRKLQALEHEYRYLIKGNSQNSQQEGLGWVAAAIVIGGVAVGGAVIGWILRGHFGTASSKLNKLIQQYDRLIAEADAILQQVAPNDPRYQSWRQKVGRTRNTAITTVATTGSFTDQIMDIVKLGVFAYIGFKVWQAIQKRRNK